jgi:P27 family predicted phage terminase small subunit
MRGRKPKPAELKIVQGTFRKDRANPRQPAAHGYLTEPPEHLNEEQKQIWRDAIADAPKSLLKKIDRSNFEVWVVSYGTYRECQRLLAKTSQVIKTTHGNWITNPILTNMNKQAAIMLKAASEMGFTPASRSRVVAESDVEVDNPWARLADGS